jgi:multiple sugar transport system substrate-binding protein
MPDIPLPTPVVLPPQSATAPTPAGGSQASNTPTNMPINTPLPPESSPAQVPLPPASVGALSSLSSNSVPKIGTPLPTPLPQSGAPMPGAPIPTGAPNAPGSPTPPGVPVPTSSTVRPGGTPVTSKATPQFAKPKNPVLKFLPWIVGMVVVLGLLAFLFTRFFGGSSTPSETQKGTGTAPAPVGGGTPGQAITLEYWGLWEPAEVFEEVFKEFEKDNPGVQVRYTKQSHRDYRERLQTAISSGNGPDLFRFHASWTPMLKEELAAMPSSVYTTTEFQDVFYPVAYKQLQSEGQLFGVPLMYDGLALFYNKKMFETAGIQPPKTWVELRNAAKALTLSSGSTIERGGVALGSAKNVDHFSDIVAFLLLQNGADLKKPNSQETKDAISFYTNFVTVDKVWSDTLPSSTIAFSRGDVAMIFAPSWRAHEILALNPDLSFATTTLPKLSTEQISWANYWAEGVSSKGKNKQAAWNLLKYLSSAEVQQKLYSTQSKTRSFGELYSRKDLADSLANAPYVEAFLQDAPYAQGWYLSSNTFDKGIDDQMIKYYEDAITASMQGKQLEQVLETLGLGTTQILRQYNATGSN